jgi:Domain of unknown function (DUF4982)
MEQVKVYSNCGTVELFVNGVSQGSRNATGRLSGRWTATSFQSIL